VIVFLPQGRFLLSFVRNWLNLTPTLYTKTTFTDLNVESGKTYYYYVVAVDTAGNESLPSEVGSDTVP